tara:strand:+ start:203 stop:898 length:696 start_codon:yes stop_codon:yes gene_type:complete
MEPKFKFTRRQWLAAAFGFLGAVISRPLLAQTKIRRIPIQYIAALAPEGATSGTGAETWGLWKVDPGPIGVWLRLYQALQKAGNIAPAGWRFDIDDWWLDENGLIMKAPEFPIPAGQYYVTNGEENISLLAVEEPDAEGKRAWTLTDGKTIGDVTHGPCRSARYTPEGESGTCSPEYADRSAFPLKPGEAPPLVSGCNRKSYAVLIVFGVASEGTLTDLSKECWPRHVCAQ